MSFYRDVVLPKLCHLAMRNSDLLPYQRQTVEAADGRILEAIRLTCLNATVRRDD